MSNACGLARLREAASGWWGTVMTADLLTERDRTHPDYVVYTPGSLDGSTHDTGNEHFFVFDGPDGSLLAIWSQSTQEHQPDHRAVIARSDDGGVSWSQPQRIAGTDEHPASWVFPVVSTRGRIYAFYQGKTHADHSWQGGLCKYSDDAGRTWSQQGTVPAPGTLGLIWQRPMRLSQGKPFAGFTRGIPKGVLPPQPIKSWVANPSVVGFVRFENIDEHPDPPDVKLAFFCSGDDALKVGMQGYPHHPVAQEPSIVLLPDGRLFCVMRTIAGSPYYSISADEGLNWSTPQVLRLCDEGEPLLHPLSPCPIYPTAQDDYFMLIHNHDRWQIVDGNLGRRPLCIVRGEFRAGADQPIWFSKPQFFMDTDGVAIGYENRVDGLAMYSSVTHSDGQTTLWYPDRKLFLLGRVIRRDMLDAMAIVNV
jgi:hypothetical protein